MKMLELFSGSKTVAGVFAAHGYETFTVDNNQELEPDLCADILSLPIDYFKTGSFEVVWASPPCTTFSVITIGKNYDQLKRPKTSGAYIGLALVLKTLEIINHIKPKYWFIENPRGMLRNAYFMRSLPRRVEVTYCQYGLNYRKPTDIWTNNLNWLAKKTCNNGDNCHEASPRGSSGGVQNLSNAFERGKIPELLAEEIAQACLKSKVEQKTIF